MKKIAGYISPLQKFLVSPPQNEIRAARPDLHSVTVDTYEIVLPTM